MKKEIYKKIVLYSLLELEPNKEKFSKTLKHYIDNPDIVYNAPVNPLYFQNIDSKHVIIITNTVYETLKVIEDYNFRNKKEVPFILYGKETKGGAIVFDDIDCDFKKLEDDTASFTNIEDYLFLKIRRFTIDNEKNKVICIGHTHPFNDDPIVFNYSLTDLIINLHLADYNIFQESKYNNKIFSLMKSITKDYNFIYYDIERNRFFKAPKVYLQIKKKEFIPLSAYQYCND